jgi:hypothetical protein
LIAAGSRTSTRSKRIFLFAASFFAVASFGIAQCDYGSTEPRKSLTDGEADPARSTGNEDVFILEQIGSETVEGVLHDLSTRIAYGFVGDESVRPRRPMGVESEDRPFPVKQPVP